MRFWLLSSLMVLQAPGAPGRVEIDVSGLEQHMDDEALHRFHGDLLMRLLEAGHGVGNGGAVELSMVSDGQVIAVECRVGEQLERVEVDDTDAPVLGLELVHRAVELVELCAPPSDSIEPSDAVFMDAGALSVTELSALLVDLAEQPITLTAVERSARWRLCVSDEPSGGAIVIPIDHSCDAALSTASLAADPPAAVERWREPIDAPIPAPEAVLVPVPDRVTEHPPAEISERVRQAWGPSLGVAGGLQLRLPGSAANFRADLAGVHPSGLVLGATAVLAPSRAEQLRLIDGAALASAGWRVVVSERIVLRPSVGLGLAIHRFAYPGEAVGHRLDLAIRVPLELDLRLAKQTFLSLAIAGDFGTKRIEHRVTSQVDEATIWTRSPVRLDALVGLRFDWLRRSSGAGILSR